MNTIALLRRGRFPFALVAVLILTALALGACGPRGGLSDRYVAEKLAWQAQKLRRAMRENPELATDEKRAELFEKYREIIRLFPPPTAPVESLSEEERDVASVSGLSRMRLAAMSAEAEDMGEAVRLYTSVADSYSFDRGMSVDASMALAAAHDRLGQRLEARAILERIVEEWPPAERRDGRPDLRVVRIPLRIATGHLLHRDEANAADAFERARDYYRGLMSEWADTPTAEASMGLLAESFELEGRFGDAVAAYEEFDRAFGREDNRASLWLKLAELYGARLGNRTRAADYYRSVEADYPDRPEGGTASIALAAYDIEDGKYVEARSRLQSVLDRFPNNETACATALQHLAVSFELGGQWDSAVAQYNALATQYPATVYGLSAPIHVAGRYEEMGEATAAQTALERAVEHYSRVVRDYAGTPAELAARNYIIAVRTKQGRWSEVAEALTETARRYPTSAAAAGMLLRAAEIQTDELGDPEAGRALLETVVREHPDSDAAEEARRRLQEHDQQ